MIRRLCPTFITIMDFRRLRRVDLRVRSRAVRDLRTSLGPSGGQPVLRPSKGPEGHIDRGEAIVLTAGATRGPTAYLPFDASACC